ncbi:MAG: hypothetical protein GY765_13530 [bacterium]|nr:hypothetical protein [bacterium]
MKKKHKKKALHFRKVTIQRLNTIQPLNTIRGGTGGVVPDPTNPNYTNVCSAICDDPTKITVQTHQGTFCVGNSNVK